MVKAKSGQYSDEEAAKRAEEAIRRSFSTPHKPRKAIAPATTRGEAQRKRRATSSPKSR
jgi:hypothetical protein